MQGVKDAVAEEVERCMRLGGSAGRAADILTACASWLPVEHVIVYIEIWIRQDETEPGRNALKQRNLSSERQAMLAPSHRGRQDRTLG
ncbi:MAG: hypothetical protein LJE70_06865 [Chromatiaceae bacterium]|nr:hypothetical protein [Chromatiaceae bacterium]